MNIEVSEGGYSLWIVSPLNARVRIANLIKHSPLNGIDTPTIANEIARAVNRDHLFDALVGALEYLVKQAAIDLPENNKALLQARSILSTAKGE